MSTKRSNGKQSPIRKYSQQVLSGWGDSGKQRNENGKGNAEGGERWNVSPEFWKQESYTVLIPVVIKRTFVPGEQYEFDVSIPLNVDFLVSPTGGSSKGALKQVSSIPKAQSKDTGKIHLVYGISSKGGGSLSPASQPDLPRTIAYLYGRILGQVHRTVECWLLHSGKEAPGTNDTGSGDKGTQSPKGLGKR